jgi:hypothetical protein
VRYSPTGKNVMLEALDEGAAAGAKYGSLHSAYSVTGANELTGGSPAYARKALTWAGASAGAKALSSAVVFDAPAGSTVQFFGLWDALTSGNRHPGGRGSRVREQRHGDRLVGLG